MTHEYSATIVWTRGDAAFTDNRYSRGHTWKFDGLEVPGSSAPSSVRLPYSVAEAVDPEEALVAAVSSCHMLFFLSFAAKDGLVVDRYEDAARGVMTKNENGKFYVSTITLNPAVTFSGAKRPAQADVDALHHRSHEECFIANSVKSEIVVNPTFSIA
ncbi:MAG: OsmC family protein [Variibacter sp.]